MCLLSVHYKHLPSQASFVTDRWLLVIRAQWTLCGRRFLINRKAEFNETWYNDSMEGVVNARSSFLKWVMQRPLVKDCILATRSRELDSEPVREG